MSDHAQQLISENKKTRAPLLDLGNCGLEEIPLEVSKLVWLESVSLAGEWYECDGENWKRCVSKNSGDSNYRLIDIGPLADLSELRSLYVSHTQVADLSPLAGLTALQAIDVSHTQVAHLTPLANLTALHTLHVS